MRAIVRSLLLVIASICLFPLPAVFAQALRGSEEHRSRACLYMMRNLEYTFQTWRSPDTSAEELGEWVRLTRNRLNDIQVNAETYDLDDDIIRAYQDVHSLLDDYESFLKDVVYFDLTANVAKPEQRTFVGEASGAIQMAFGGLDAGRIGGPIGAAIGFVVGGGAGVLTGFHNYSSAISRDERINQTVKDAKLQLITHLQRKFEATSDKLKTRAKLLSGPEKYNWNNEVGFDGSATQTFDEQLNLRPRDSFLFMQSAIQLADEYPVLAFERMRTAAAFVPDDFGTDSDIFDKDKAELLITAMQIAEDGILSGKCERDLSKAAMACYTEAIGILRRGPADLKPETRLLYARLCGLAGQPDIGLQVLAELKYNFSTDPWYQYELAGVACQCNDVFAATECLQNSANLLPRWQPSALHDPKLRTLRESSPGTVEKFLCPLLVGTWKDDKGLVLDFYLDGRLRQSRNGDVKNGTYKELSSDQLELTTAGTSRVFSYQASHDSLTLSGNGKDFTLRRELPPLVGSWQYSDVDRFEFRSDGTWTRTYGLDTTHGTYMIIPGKYGAPPQLRYTRNRKSLYQPTKLADFRVSGNVLTVTPVGSSTTFTYSR